MSYYVYLLISTNGATYVGSTIDLERRLRQHNGDIKGGAKRTTNLVSSGEKWERKCYISGFPTWNSALQFEWRWKQLTRKIKNNTKPIDKRMTALNTLLELERPTTKAVPYTEWETPPQIHYEETNII